MIPRVTQEKMGQEKLRQRGPEVEGGAPQEGELIVVHSHTWRQQWMDTWRQQWMDAILVCFWGLLLAGRPDLLI